MKYSYDRSYRDSLIKEAEGMIKKLDEKSTEKSWFIKLIDMLKKLLGFIKKLLGFDCHTKS